MKTAEMQIKKLIDQAGGDWGIMVEDVENDISWGYRTVASFPAESVIKIPIMAAVFSAAENKELKLCDHVKVHLDDRVGGAGALQYLTPGIELSVYDLLVLMIVQSDNTATNVLIDLVGIEHIQQTLSETGMKDSSFQRKLMVYPAQSDLQNTVTVADVNLMLRKLIDGQLVSRHACEQMIQILKWQQFRNGLPSKLPSPMPKMAGGIPKWELAHKTGWDTDRQHDVGILFTGNRTMIVSVLSDNVSSETAWNVMGDIGKIIYDYALNS
ncbi:serine hydrolase [Siminovitchia terrae]|uniref:Serine hydrolase n=1 Tax=Siminovitchia terrae TaxID=1914933 RepID=A0ABQ4L1L7_SIMTE|nr:serine hydrolase [Siminovitchia terrae]GIN97764.1 serine hydrolase [Siminovitchia terrae]